MSATSKENVQLLRAVVKHPTLYDRGDENYRKRLPSENSWDMVASEVGESVEKCKRRWRQLRNDYTRWCNADANRRRQGQRRFAYPLAEEVRFLDRHLNLTDAGHEDEERSGSEKDRDSNRGSESRDNNPPSVKGDATLEDKSVNEESLETQLLREKDSSAKEVDKDKTKEKPKQKKAAQEKSAEKELVEPDAPERTPEQDSYLQSDQEGDEPIEEEHLEQLEDFNFNEETLQEKEKESEEKTADSPASQSEFFIKQNKDPHLLIIGKKHSTFPSGEPAAAEDSSLGDPLEETAMEESTNDPAGKSLRRRNSTQSPSRRLRRLKEVPIKKPTQRLTRFQRTKSMSMAAGQSIRSSTSPVKLTPVPRTVVASKSVQVKKVGPLQDDIFPRPAVPAAEGRQSLKQSITQSQPQRQQVIFTRRGTAGGNLQGTPSTPPRKPAGRPPKKLEIVQRLVGPRIRHNSPSTPNVLTISKPSSLSVNTGTAIGNMGSSPGTNTTGNLTKVGNTTLKPSENIALMNYSPSSSSSPTASTTKASSISSPSATMATGVSPSTAAVPAISVPPHLTLLKRCERTTQTECQDIFSDDHFLEMIRPQMKEMNARQKMHFKKKVFQALMETFDDATDFPEAGELQHFNINTPSGFEHVTSPELRLIRELVSMVSAAKVSARGQPQSPAQPPAQSQPKEGVCYTTVPGSDILRGTRGLNIPRHLIQRVYKPSTGVETAANNAAGPGPGPEKKMYRFLQMTNGKPNGGSTSASMEDLRKDSVDSDQSLVRSANIPPATPKGATVVAAVRPQGSSINTFFGQPNSVSSVKSGPSLKARALARRYSICSNGNQATNGLSINQVPVNAGSLNSNLSPMEAAALKRRLMAPAHPMVPPTQRPRYSGPGVQQIVTPQGNSLLVRKSLGNTPGNQKQPSPTTTGAGTQKTPQIMNVQGGAFKDFVQPKAAAATSPGSPSSSASGEGSASQSIALKRSLVVASAKGTSLLAEKPANKPKQPQPQKPNQRYSSMTAATIAADDFSLASLKREPVDHMEDQDDILGM